MQDGDWENFFNDIVQEIRQITWRIISISYAD